MKKEGIFVPRGGSEVNSFIAKDSKMQEKRQKLLDCSLVLFSEKGYLNTPVRDIIDSSGFGTSTFYKYFNNKEDVLKILLANFLEQIITSLIEYYKREDDLYQRYIETKRVILEVFAQNHQLSEIYCRVAGISDGVDNCLKEFEDKLLMFFSKNTRYGISQGFFRECQVDPISHATLGMIKYAVYKWIILKEITKEEMIDMVISFHQTLATGLVNKDKKEA